MGSSISLSQRGRTAASFAAVAIVATGLPLAVTASQAEAATTCTAWKVTDSHIGADDNWANARCTSIGATTKVRAWLDVNADSDKYSSWFTVTNTTYSTPKMNCFFGCSAKYDTASR